MWDHLWLNISLMTMPGGSRGLGIVQDGALAVSGEYLAFAGARTELSGSPEKLALKIHDGGGAFATPALIDCHTHLVYGGNRSREFEARLDGTSYEEISRRGGGIIGTVKATRNASEEELLSSARRRLDAMMCEGLGTIEIKSGYGLRLEDEKKMLRAARSLGENNRIQIKTTFLGAHALPVEYVGRSDAYIHTVCEEMIPEISAENLADAVDVFCEGIGFSPQQTRRVFEAARKHGLAVKIHAEQLSNLGGAELASEYDALSADHLEYLSEEGVLAMAETGMVAVLLPGAFYYLRETKKPPIDLLRLHGVPIALATDANPGSSPIFSPLLILNMGCVFFGLTVEEALLGMTRNASRALGLSDTLGSLEAGKLADFVLWDIESPADLVASIGIPRLRLRSHRGSLFSVR